MPTKSISGLSFGTVERPRLMKAFYHPVMGVKKEYANEEVMVRLSASLRIMGTALDKYSLENNLCKSSSGKNRSAH
jgi:hypothetical protein